MSNVRPARLLMTAMFDRKIVPAVHVVSELRFITREPRNLVGNRSQVSEFRQLFWLFWWAEGSVLDGVRMRLPSLR